MSTMYHESDARRNLRDLAEEQRKEGLRREAFSYEDFLGRVDQALGPVREQPSDWERMEAARFVSYIDAKGQQSVRAEIARPRTFEDTVDDLLIEVADLIIERQRTYGPSNIEQQGIFGIVNRIGNDKLARIRQRLQGSIVNGEIVLEDIDLGSVNEPGIINDLADVIGYAVCGILLLRGEWGRPLAGDE